jgi:LPXTG-motif cell wall-anchored protein
VRPVRKPLPALVLVALALVLPASAQADGDPASDVLLLQDVYLPYAPGVPKPLGDTITRLLKTTRKAGFTLKVAIIAKPQDLGAVPQYFAKPQSYAPFLESEIAFNTKKPLLVVMPQGYGVAGMPAGAEKGIEGLAQPKSADGQDLARAAITAIVRTSKAAGHPVATPKLPKGGGGGSGTSPAIVLGVPVALLALGGLLMAIRRRQEQSAAP